MFFFLFYFFSFPGEQSDEEDSTNQSPVESIPIRGKKSVQKSCPIGSSLLSVNNWGKGGGQLWKDDRGESSCWRAEQFL